MINKFLNLTACLAAFFLVSISTYAQIVKTSPDSLGGYKKVLDAKGKLLAWYKPDVPGAAYVHVAKLASEFIKSGTPVDPKTGLKIYLIACCFQGPHMRPQQDFVAGKTWDDWMHNPACVFAGMVQSLALDYRVFSGDSTYIDVVREMLDYQIKNGTTPIEWPWGGVPYASSDPGVKIYNGATKWERDGMRGDGLFGIEPDKVGELGYAYVKFYEVTGDEKYLKAGLLCADALAKNVRDVKADASNFTETKLGQSPWPFRVNARNGAVISEYTSHVIDCLKLFDELIRIKDRISLKAERAEKYASVRKMVLDWMYDKNGPMKTYVWNGYFEDIPNDEKQTNRNQVSPMEFARYLLKNPKVEKNYLISAQALTYYVKTAFGTEGMDAIKEQTWCFEPMASHTARYASVCALLYEKTGNSYFKEEAYRYFNNATYLTDQNGVVRVGPTWPGSWFSDGYSDYIKHFMEGIAAIPEWAPEGENHLLRSTSAVQKINYQEDRITFSTYDDNGNVVLRLKKKPVSIKAGNKTVTEKKDGAQEYFTWKNLGSDGILRLNYKSGNNIVINF